MEGTETQEPVVMATQQEIKDGTARAFATPGVKNTVPSTADKNQPPAATPVAVTPAPVVADKPTGEVTPVLTAKAGINYDDLSDDERDEMIAKLTGGKVKSVKEITEDKPVETAEQKAEKALAKKQKALQHALSTGKIKQEDYDNAVIVKNKNNRDIALDLFAKDVLEDNPKSTPEEIEELFRDYYMEEIDEKDASRKLRLKEMNRVADNYRATATKNVDGIEGDYDAYETKEQKLTSYGKQVDAVFETLQKDRTVKFSYPGPNNTTLEVELPYSLDDADIKSLKRNIRSANVFQALDGDKKELKDKDILGAIEYDLSANTFSKVISAVAAKAAEKGKMDAEAFYKAIPLRTSENLGASVSEKGDGRKPLITPEMRARFPKSSSRN